VAGAATTATCGNNDYQCKVKYSTFKKNEIEGKNTLNLEKKGIFASRISRFPVSN
jgi:hypothetical protein